MFPRLLFRLVSLGAAVLLLIATWPQVLGLQRTFVIAQLVAFRGFLVLAALALLLLSLIALWRAQAGRSFLMGTAAIFLVVVLGNMTVIASRGVPTTGPQAATSARQEGEIRVLAWNTLNGAPGAERIAAFASEHQVNVLALPETTLSTAQAIATAMAAAGQPVQVFVLTTHPTMSTRATALLIGDSLGAYELDESLGSTPRLPSVLARPVSGDGPSLIAAHPVPPLPSYLVDWEPGLAWLAERCRDGNTIVAGDLNATLDHFAGLHDVDADLGSCRSGALATGRAALGTWPSQLPLLLAAPIDHVLATPEWTFDDFRVVTELDGLGSDHRALLATLVKAR